MDALIDAAARRLADGEPLEALKLVALRNDAPGLALRGIALAQLGAYPRARELLRGAAKAFGSSQAVARARCVVAEAEIALASRDLGWTARQLDAARAVLEAHGDIVNALQARYLEVRRLLLVGRLDDAERALARMPDRRPLPLAIGHEMIRAQLALRRLRPREARAALERAKTLAARAGIHALLGEVDAAVAMLAAPAARLIAQGEERVLRMDDVEAVLASPALIVDDCRHAVRQRKHVVDLRTRPVLLVLARTLAERAPAEVPRDVLVRRAFRLPLADETHRARLRVQIGRLRKLLAPLAGIEATAGGFALRPRGSHGAVVLAPPTDDRRAGVLALLADGESWSTSALAEALGASQRTVQRSLETLARTGKVHSYGHGRARRWTTPALPGFTTLLLLPAGVMP